MVKFQGAHGTTACRAKCIESQGFQVNAGYHGVGVYFWRQNAFSRDLAIGWFLNARNIGSYSQDNDRRCAIIYAAIVVDEEKCFDLNSSENEDAILEIIRKNGFSDALDASRLFDDFVDLVQQRVGYEFKLIQTRIKAPKSAKSWPWQSMGRPICYVVKDSSCISIDRVEVLENSEIEL
jgi:hypothetical protein